MRPLSALKNFLVPSGRKPRQIVFGPFRGIAMKLSLQHQAQVYLGLFERETHPWLIRLSQGVKTAIDIGAAHGEYTLFFLKKTNAARIFAFEPDATCLPFLRENLRLNAADDSNNSGRLEISRAQVGESDGGNTVTLDSMMPSVRPPCFIKMDVDGAEVDVLKGAKALNTLPGLRWLIETHSEALERQSVELLRAAGFETKIIRNAWWRLLVPELRPGKHNRWLAAWKTSV